jgi:peptidoglycan hydrolase CwlO-like protein
MVINVDKKQLILFGIGLILITILVSALFRRADTFTVPDNSYKHKIDSLNIELTHIRNKQTILGSQIKRYRDSINISNQRIDSLSEELTSTQKYYGKKIKDITSYSHSELSDFFTNRYK